MSIFSNTDKKKQEVDWLDIDDLALVDVTKDLNTSLNMEPKLFNKFNPEEVETMLEESSLLNAVQKRGYPDAKLHLDVLNEYDNRIYIRTKSDQILVHLRLKVSEFQLKGDEEKFPMVYIDWLLTQNIKLNPKKLRKQLYFGQEYPGLGVLNELTEFIRLICRGMGSAGAFNVPEYFHDAVLFSRKFRFIDPEKEGMFRALVHCFRRVNLREISRKIHQGKILFEDGTPYQWRYGEMITCSDSYLEKKIFNESYFRKSTEIRDKTQFIQSK